MMWITIIVLGVVVSAFTLLLVVAKRKMGSIPSVANSPKVFNFTDQNFSNKIKNGVVLVDFWAAWCGPCKMMGPVLNDLAEDVEGKVTIAKVNVEEQKMTASKFKIRSIPTMILFKNGAEIHRFTGFKSKDTILREFERRSLN
jgi:thioredoxin 1